MQRAFGWVFLSVLPSVDKDEKENHSIWGMDACECVCVCLRVWNRLVFYPPIVFGAPLCLYIMRKRTTRRTKCRGNKTRRTARGDKRDGAKNRSRGTGGQKDVEISRPSASAAAAASVRGAALQAAGGRGRLDPPRPRPLPRAARRRLGRGDATLVS